MKIVQFAVTVKYNGQTFFPYTNIEANDEDIPKMLEQGAFLINDEVVDTVSQQEIKPKKIVKHKGRLND